MADRLPTLYPVPFDGGGGPTQACRHIAKAMYDIGVPTPLFVLRSKIRTGPIEFVPALPAWSSRLPRARTQAFGRRRLERLYFGNTRPHELCVLWPGVSEELVRALKERGNPVVLEATNTPMRHARHILDRAFCRIGTEPVYSITDNRIAEEETLHALADAIFCPSPIVEEALREGGFGGRILSTSRGTALASTPPPDRGGRASDAPLLCLFVGTGSVRKGLDRLLELWPDLPDRFRLRIVGRLKPHIEERFAEALAHPRIELAGFSNDVMRQYEEADIFLLPSLEEGDPKVTYEAASAGLPLVVSRAGGGRLLQETSACLEIDPQRPETISRALLDLAARPEYRLELGCRARRAVQRYDWTGIARRRLALLRDAFPAHVPALGETATAE